MMDFEAGDPIHGEVLFTILLTDYERVIFTKHTGGYHQFRIPGILAAGDALLLACEARAENRGDWGDIDILVLRMEADGAPAEVLRIGESALPPDGTMRTYNNPVLIPDQTRVHLIYHRNYERALIVSSEDGGRTWSGSRDITSCYSEFPYQWNVCATGPGHGIAMRGGRLIAPIWLANGELTDGGLSRRHVPSIAGCIYSDDRGQTWHAGALAETIINGNETSVAELPDGRLLFNFRNMHQSHVRILGLSSDGGETLDRVWESKALQDPWCFGGMTAADGSVVFVNCNSAEKRENITVKSTLDAGETWETIWNVDTPGGYADIAHINGTVFIFYERFTDNKGIISELVLKKARLTN